MNRSKLAFHFVCWVALLVSFSAGCQSQESLLDSYADKSEQDEQSSHEMPAPSVHDQQPEATAQAATRVTPISDQAFRDAAYGGDGERVAKAVESGVDVNSPDENGRTALMLAAFDGHSQIVKFLLQHKAQVDRRDTMDRTALTYSASGKNPETVKLLLEAGADVNMVDNGEGWTALMFACAEGNIEVVKLLLEHGANPLFADEDGETPLQFAANNGHAAVVELLKQNIEARKGP